MPKKSVRKNRRKTMRKAPRKTTKKTIKMRGGRPWTTPPAQSSKKPKPMAQISDIDQWRVDVTRILNQILII